jgi:CDP-4-dehydro-6-deoxyglucose reductase
MPIVKLSNGHEFMAGLGTSLIDAAQLGGFTLPHSCKIGRCSTCKCKVLRGETTALQAETGLNEQEKADGWILSCVRSAVSDVTLEVEDLEGVVLPQIKTLPCRISSIDRLSIDVIRVTLRLPPMADLSVIPGQYIDVIGHSGIRRSYSIANISEAGKALELHIRAVDGGVMSDYWFNKAKPNDLLRLNGPFGTFFLRKLAQLNLVFLATGTGIAPVKAMLESIVDLPQEKAPQSVTVFWGGRTAACLYFDVQAIPAGQQFVPVLSRPDSNWTGIKGHVQNALLAMKLDLSNTAVYACGSEAMIRSANSSLLAAGLLSSRFFSDAFVSSAPNN